MNVEIAQFTVREKYFLTIFILSVGALEYDALRHTARVLENIMNR
jgi:hypothetical protein